MYIPLTVAQLGHFLHTPPLLLRLFEEKKKKGKGKQKNRNAMLHHDTEAKLL